MRAKNDPNRVIRLGLLAIALALAVACVRPAIGQPKEGAEHQQYIQKLIQALASPNKAPSYVGPKDDYPRVKIPFGYDRASQRKVLEAWRLLLEEGVTAFPALVAGATDQRYSCTIADTPGDGESNDTVGAVCRLIMRNQVEAICCRLKHSYGPNTIWHRAALESGFYGDLEKWWQERRTRSLAELQIESARYAIDILKSKALGGSDRDVQRREDIKELESLISLVKASGQPIDPIGIENRHCRMIGLPGEDEIWLGPHPYKSKRESVNNR
jgi:hypothetical protein